MGQGRPSYEPIVGETIDTPDGEGVVLDVLNYDEDSFEKDDRERIRLQSILGKDYESKYYRVIVEVDDENKSYRCWEIDYVPPTDPTDAPWRG